jgi:mitogen-activated protein kinase kinase
MHRNLKPSKILLNSLGQIKLSDFRASGELINSIAETVVWSKTCYMAPERILGESYTIKSEVWSFGLTIIELAIGKFPYHFAPDPDDITGEGVKIYDVLERITRDPAPRLPESDAFPDILHQMIEKCMQSDPANRSNPVELYVSIKSYFLVIH